MSCGPATPTPRRTGFWPGLRDTFDAGPRLAIAAVLVTFGTWAAVVFHFVMGQYLGRPYPWSTFLYAPSDHFAYFYNVYDQARSFHPGESAVVVYSPLLHAFVTVLTLIPAGVGLALIVAIFLATLFAVLWFVAARGVRDAVSRLQQVVVLTLLAYPVLFAIDRGNLEMVVFVLLAAFFYLYCCRRSRWAWVPLALAISLKHYWATLLVFALFAAADPPGWRGGVITVLFAVTMVPFAYCYFPIVGRPDVGISTLAYPAALVATGILVLKRPHNVPKTMGEVSNAGSVVA